MKTHRTDQVGADSRAAAILFGLGAGGLLIGAILGLNLWPVQQVLSMATSGGGKEIFLAFHGYAFVILSLFWASRPSARAQWFVLLGWLACSVLIAHGLRDSLPFSWTDSSQFPAAMFLATTLAVPCLIALAWRCGRRSSSHQDPVFEYRLRWLVALSLMFMMVPTPALSLTSTLHPLTFDRYALLWDRAAGLAFTPQLVAAVNALPGMPELVGFCYGMTPLGFLAVALLHLRGRPNHVASGLLVWVVLTSCALLAYHLFPITGPRYAFGSAEFLGALDPGMAHPAELIVVAPYPRNGMPSMHFGWLFAASVLWWQSGTRARSRAVLIAMTTLTAMATLYSGEHYTIDLIVAVPFVLAAISLSTTGVPWSSLERRGVAALGFGIWLLWVLLLRFQIDLFVDQPLWCWVLLGVTFVAVAAQVRWMRRFKALATNDIVPATAKVLSPLQAKFGWLFFFSGMAALVYQVLFAKELALVFGSTATATFTVLATFLGGMALGSLIGGALAQRVSRPIVAYALVELGIALYCVATPALFKAVQLVYVGLATGMPPDAPVLTVLRVSLGAVVLLVPTVLMGTTLPLLAQASGASDHRMGTRVAWLYFANTGGAALGALLTAYFVIPALGAHRTTLVAAVMNLMVALAALELAKRLAPGAPTPDAGTARPGAAATAQPLAGSQALALAVLGVGGILSLGLEVVYVHLLSIVAGNSVYAFGLMLATFLVGLSVGGELARRWMLRPAANSIVAMGVSVLGLSATAALGAGLWNVIPDYFASFAGYPAASTFAAREAIRGLVCAAVMVPPTVFIGASYAFAMDVATMGAKVESRALGIAAAVNTAGNIAGVLLFGFVLLPRMGGLAASQAIAVCALALGLVVLFRCRLAFPMRALVVGVSAMAAVAWGQTWKMDLQGLSTGANVYFYPQNWGQVIDHAESIDGGFTSVTEQPSPSGPVKTLLTNGKFQGNDAVQGEMQAQIGFAFSPLLHTERRGSALVIGYGTGVTSRVFHEAGFRQLDVAELSRDIVRLADKHFGSTNGGVSARPDVSIHLTDGRNLLLLSRARYDVVSIEITSIWFAGAASLYNREFYQLAKSRMQSDGVLQQWVQLHRLTPADILQIVATLRSEFAYVSLYVMGSQGILVATDAADRASPVPAAVSLLETSPQLAELRTIASRSVQDMVKDRVLDPAGVDRFIRDLGVDARPWISTDDNLRLEYSTPKANVNDGRASLAANKALIERFR